MKRIVFFFAFYLIWNFSYSQWTQQISGTSYFLNDIHFLNDSVGFIVGNGGIFLNTNDYGQNWELSVINALDNLKAVFAINKDTLFAGGENLYKSIDGGLSWTAVSNNLNISEIKFFSPEVGFLKKGWNDWCTTPAEEFPKLCYLKTTDAGNTWSSAPQLPIDYLFAEMHITSDTGYLFGNLHYYEYATCLSYYFTKEYKTTDGGNTWQYVPNEMGHYTDAYFINNLEGFLLQTNHLYKINDGGSELLYINDMPDNSPGNLAFATLDEGYYTNAGKIMKTTSGGILWEEDFNGNTNISEMVITENYEGYAIGNYGFILHKKITEPVGVEEHGGMEAWGHGGWVVWPNPAKERVTVGGQRSAVGGQQSAVGGRRSAVGGQRSAVRCEIFDLFSRNLISIEDISSFPINIDISSLSPGMYILRIEGQDGVSEAVKFLKAAE